MLGHSLALSDRLARYLETIEPLNSISALGFNESNSSQIEKNLECLAKNERWSIVDLRNLDEDPARSARRCRWQRRRVRAISRS